MRLETKLIHSGVEPDESTGAIMTPIYQTSTYVQEEVGKHKGYEYSRTLNPTRHALEKNIAAIENGNYGACFGSGLAAMDCIIKTLNPGDEVISTDDLYGGSFRLFNTIFSKYGLKFHYVDMSEISNIEEKINSNTKMIWIESPSNPLLKIIDINKICEIAKTKNILVTVDNTFATPILQQPLELGADIVVHSATKYLSGHSDVVLGAVVCNSETIANEIYRIQNSSGAICGPMDSFLVLRGIKTLHVRMNKHLENTEKIVSFLKENDKINNIYWPGLANHKNHEIAKTQMKGFGGIISFDFVDNTKEVAFEFLKKLKIFCIAESLGGVESLANHPASMTHASIPKEERYKIGITDSLVRLSVGIEHYEDLIEDLKRALIPFK